MEDRSKEIIFFYTTWAHIRYNTTLCQLTTISNMQSDP